MLFLGFPRLPDNRLGGYSLFLIFILFMLSRCFRVKFLLGFIADRDFPPSLTARSHHELWQRCEDRRGTERRTVTTGVCGGKGNFLGV